MSQTLLHPQTRSAQTEFEALVRELNQARSTQVRNASDILFGPPIPIDRMLFDRLLRASGKILEALQHEGVLRHENSEYSRSLEARISGHPPKL